MKKRHERPGKFTEQAKPGLGGNCVDNEVVAGIALGRARSRSGEPDESTLLDFRRKGDPEPLRFD